ncbi:S41 family peptidase [Streptomyces sp. NPDC090025]|uniref:S41 family peptidase n=1 Tax=Streptomyces sp. NPDC090025 TaxID=3365922 RepID=UPI003832CF40
MRMVMATAVVLALVGAVAAPATTAGPRATSDPSATSRPPAVDGFWRMDGYGTVLSVQDGTLQEYQTTAVSCLQGDSATRTAPGSPVFTAPDGTVLTLRAGADGVHASLRADGSVGSRGLRRVGALPDACGRPAAGDPLAAFDVFWQTFEENYPFFAAKGVDWHQVRARYRPRVHAGTTRDELFAVFSEMTGPLRDAHVAVQDGRRVFYQVRAGTVLPSEELDARVKQFVVARDLKDATGLTEFARGRISYADLPGDRGYLRISGFGGYTDDDNAPYTAELAELDRALDTVFDRERVRRLRGLVVDLRINGGGSDALGIRIAGRLTDSRYLAYAKRVRNDPADPGRHTRPEPVYVTPAKAPRYTGPVAVLTGGSTVSAGETFTQALLDRPGRTVRIGQSTQGVFSDVMTRALPNGMAAWLPNEEFLTRSGRTFDGTGVPPHLVEPVFTEEEFAAGRDSAFDRALEVLRDRGGATG